MNLECFFLRYVHTEEATEKELTIETQNVMIGILGGEENVAFYHFGGGETDLNMSMLLKLLM